MQRLLAIFAAWTLLMHALVGCCWHHQHVAEVAAAEEPQFLPVVCGGHVHSHADHGHSHDHDAPADHRHPSDDGCGEEACRFVKAEATASPSLLDGPMAALVEFLSPLSLADGVSRSSDRVAGKHFAGIPIHLRHQVLVI